MTVTDRAHRYRAQGNVSGPRRCELCGSKRFLVVDHKDGDEHNDRPGNLRWLCKSCNTRLGATMAKQGKGRRTRQYNQGARSLGAYVTAAKEHRRGAHDAGGKVIHETPKHKREEFAREIWALRRRFNGVEEQLQALESKSATRPLSAKEQARLRALRIQEARGNSAGGFRASEYYQSLSPQVQLAVSSISFHVAKGVPFKEAVRLVKRDYPEWPVAKAAMAYKKMRTKGNPNGAAQMYKDFHGRSATEVLTMQDALMQSGDYTALGDDPELWLRPVKGDPAKWGDGDITFDPSDNVKLAANASGGQLFLVGDNQALPLADLQAQGLDTSKRFIALGEVYALSYTTEKSFDRFKSVPYAHILGEETGQRPSLVYDKETQRMFLVGGAYAIAPVDPSIGASPGIVN